MAREMTNNKAILRGHVVKEPEVRYVMLGERFYQFEVGMARRSGAEDCIPVMVSARLIDVDVLKKGTGVEITGSFRSRNQQGVREDGKNRLTLYAFADTIKVTDEVIDTDSITLNGYICKPVIHRKTPLGREIADILLAVNRDYGKSDYLPCVAWSRNAAFVSTLPVGAEIVCSGRIQSREYTKRLAAGKTEIRTAYEVSLATIDTRWVPMEGNEDG